MSAFSLPILPTSTGFGPGDSVPDKYQNSVFAPYTKSAEGAGKVVDWEMINFGFPVRGLRIMIF